MCRRAQYRDVHNIQDTAQEGAAVISHVEQEMDDLFIGEFTIDTINSDNDENAWYINVDICGKPVKFKIDTGAEANMLPLSIYKALDAPGRLGKLIHRLKHMVTIKLTSRERSASIAMLMGRHITWSSSSLMLVPHLYLD
jgi:hypothetical protein